MVISDKSDEPVCRVIEVSDILGVNVNNQSVTSTRGATVEDHHQRRQTPCTRIEFPNVKLICNVKVSMIHNP